MAGDLAMNSTDDLLNEGLEHYRYDNLLVTTRPV
jgi:hypothetical protein